MKVTWPSVIDAPLDDFMWVGSDFLTPFVLYSMDYDIYDIWNLVPDVWVQSRLLQILEVANLHGYYDMICLGCGPHLDHEDLEQLDEFDLEEMDLKWQVAMISMRLKKFYKKTGRRLQFDAKEPVGFDKTKVECFNFHNTGHFAREFRLKGNQESRRRDAGNTGYRAKDNERRPGKQEEPKALVTLDGEGVDWTGHAEDEQENFALMAYSNSGSDTEVKSCSKECVESYAKLKKLYDEQREQLGDATEAVKEKEELKTKVEIFQSSSKGLSKLLNSQMSTMDKSGLVYGNQIHEGVLSYEKEVLESVFDSRSSDVEDSPVHDIFANVEGMHAIPPPMIGNYMPSGPDREVDDSIFTYGPKQSKTSESNTQTSNFNSCESNSSVETLESVPELVVVEPKVRFETVLLVERHEARCGYVCIQVYDLSAGQNLNIRGLVVCYALEIPYVEMADEDFHGFRYWCATTRTEHDANFGWLSVGMNISPFELLYVENVEQPISGNEVGERLIEGSGIKGKLSPRFIVPVLRFWNVLERFRSLALPPPVIAKRSLSEMSLCHIQPDMSLSEEPESILDRQERVMRNKVIPFVKILWKNHQSVRSRGSDFDIPVVFSLIIALLRNKVRIFLIPTPLTIIMIYALLRSFRYNTRHSYVQEEVIESNNVQNDAGNIQRILRTASSGTVINILLAKQDKAGVILTNEQNDFLFADVSWIEEIMELSANICLMARIQLANIDGSSNDSTFLSEVQTPSTSYVNPLFAKDYQEQKYPTQPKIINKSIGDNQIDSNIIFDEPNEDVNSGSVENDNNVQDSYELEQLARSAYKEAKKPQIIAKKVQQQNIMLTKQLELYKEKGEIINEGGLGWLSVIIVKVKVTWLDLVIMESLVKKKQKGAILELKRRHLKNTIFCTYTPYPLIPIRDDQLSEIEEHIEEEVTEIMAETMEQYMSKTREDYGSNVTRPTINQDTPFKLKGQFLKELRDNTFSGSEQEDADEHIEKVLEIVDLFHILKVTQDQIMLRAFPISLTGAASRWLRNQPSGSITTWEGPNESLFRAWERFKELLMKYPQHYLTDMQEVILFYNGLDVPTRQILDSKGGIPSKTAAAKTTIQEMAEYSQKWYNGTSKTAIQ
ncbi:hypothetical protein Tco_0497862 [Tanacetum coccineum]